MTASDTTTPAALAIGMQIRAARKAAKLSQKELAAACGWTNDDGDPAQARISNYEKGKREAGLADIEAIAAATGTPIPFFFSATKDTLNKPSLAPVIDNARRIPLINYVQAGAPAEVTDPYAAGGGMDMIGVDEWRARELGPHAFALRVKGNSMEPEIRDGDIVIVDPSAAPRPGDFVVAKVNGDQEATLKKYRSRGRDDAGEVFELVPLNDDYPTLLVNASHPGRIIGRVVELRKNF